MPEERASLQERFESSRVGRILISVFVVVTVAAIVMTNTQDSKLRREFVRIGQPYLNALGLDQAWDGFAPDPRREVVDLRADVTCENGRTVTWTYPRANDLFGVYWDYRWRKYAEWVTGTYRETLFGPTAAFAARAVKSDDCRPQSVTLVRRYYRMTAPGQPVLPRVWNEETLGRLEPVTPSMLGEDGS